MFSTVIIYYRKHLGATVFDRIIIFTTVRIQPDPLMEDFANAISYELKKEIADRYFGFRLQIETESKEYSNQVQLLLAFFDETVRPDIQKMYTLLKEHDAVLAFSLLVGLPQNNEFFDSLMGHYAMSPGNNLFQKNSTRGWTRKSRYKNLVHDTYSSLEKNMHDYLKKYNLLIEEHNDLSQRVTAFSRNNDLSLIFSLLQRIDCTGPQTSTMLYSEPSHNLHQNNARGMDIHLPDSVEKKLPFLASIPPLKTIRKQLNTLIDTVRI